MRCRRIVNGDVVWFGAIPEQIPPQKSLEKTTWDELEAICHRGLHTSYFKVGDKKTVNVNGKDYSFVIADFDRYDIIGKDKKACITFMMENVYQDDLQMNTKSQIKETDLIQAYNMRTTADSLPVVDESTTTVHKITGASAASINLATVKDQTIVSNGVTFIGSATDGTVQMTGSVTEENEYATATVTSGFYLPVGTYTLYAPHKADKVGWHVRNAQGTSIAELNWNGTTTAVNFTVSVAGDYHLYVFIPRGAGTLNYTETPMLLRGDRTASLPAFEPYYAGIKSAGFRGITSTGRNLIASLADKTVSADGITAVANPSDGTVTINGKPTTVSFNANVSVDFYLPRGTYTIYAPHRTMRFAGWLVKSRKSGATVGKIDWAQLGDVVSKTFTVTEPGEYYIRFFAPMGYNYPAFENYVETPMILPGALTENFPAFETYHADASFALTTPVTLEKWDYIDVDAKKLVTGTATLTQETPFTEEQLAQYTDYILSADCKTIAYKMNTETETPISIPETYKAWRGGCEYIIANADQEQNLDSLEITVDQTYSVVSFGWQPSDIRETTLPMLFETLDQHLQHAIETVGIESYAGNELVKTYDKLFIPATFEIENLRGTDKQFAYYRSIKPGSVAVNRIRYLNNVAQAWWTRDSSQIETQMAYLANGNRSSISTAQSAKIPICFCIGERQSVYTQFFNENDKHDNYADKQQAVADSLTQRLSVIKSELWYNVYYGLPLLDKLQTKFPLDAFVTKTVQEHPDVVSIKSFTSKVVDHHYTCVMTIQSKYGEIQLNI